MSRKLTSTKSAAMDPRPVDLTSRLRGSHHALKSMGLTLPEHGLSQEIANLGKNRLGVIAEPAPHAGATSMGPFTTSGTLTNPKVAAAEPPNYEVAQSPATACTTCAHYTARDATLGACDKYDFFARGDYTCDGWEPPNNAPSHLD